MDELEQRLSAHLRMDSANVSNADDTMRAGLHRAIKRRRTVRTAVTSVGAFAVVGVLGVAAWGVVGNDTPSPAETTTTSPSPTPMPTESTATATPTPAPGESTAGDPFAAENLPPLASPREFDDAWYSDPGYPEAYVMVDWVWDHVGQGWGIGTAATILTAVGAPEPEDGVEPLPAVLYLRSPEGLYFEVAELPIEWSDDTTVVAWDEDAERVSLQTRNNGGTWYYPRTGVFDEIEFSIGGEPSRDEIFVAADAAGNELWRAFNDNGDGFYRWSNGTWSKASTWTEAPDAREPEQFPGLQQSVLDPSGSRVLLTTPVIPRVEGESNLTEIVVYDLTADTTTVYPAPTDTEFSDLMHPHWVNNQAVSFVSWIDGEQVAVEFTLRDALTYSVGESVVPEDGSTLPNAVDVFYGEATPMESTVRVCGC